MDEMIHVSTSSDKMEAYIVFSAPDLDGEKLQFEQVLRALEHARIVYGIDQKLLREIFEERQYEKEYRVAVGKRPIDGVDGKVIFRYTFEKDIKPKLDERGNVDYFNLDNYISVKAGEVVAEYQPPTQAVSGINVYGGIVKGRDGKNIRMPVGKNVQLLDDKITMVAKCDGLLEFIGGNLVVSPVLSINGDVDLTTGNIDFIGDVKIRGNVCPGMKVVAQGFVEVGGMVEAATIESRGDIVINGGVKGMGKAVLKAEGRVAARYIENATVCATQSVTASSIIQSTVECQGTVEVIGARSSIIGGSVKAMNSVICKNIGSENYIPTSIEVGMLPEYRRRLHDLTLNIQKIQAEIENLEKITHIPDDSLSEQQKVIKQRLLEERQRKTVVLKELETQLEEVNEKIQINEKSFISVEDTVHIGVCITINNSKMMITSPYKFVTFRLVDGEIVAMQHK
ncbi:MAG: FapA family protein [Clostridia bacterium]|nr:FapA family protein [Clostridia bacterium]